MLAYLREIQAKGRYLIDSTPTIIIGAILLVETGQSIELMIALKAPPAPALAAESNAIGSRGAEQVGAQLPIEVRPFRIVDPVTGKTRIYDGRFIGTDQLVEIKSTTRGFFTLSSRVREQMSFDVNMSPKPVWIFVNGTPSTGLIRELQSGGIPWHQLHP